MPGHRGIAGLVFALIYFMLSAVTVFADDVKERVGGHDPAEALRLGEQMYRTGILPSGKPMMAIIRGDSTVEGTAFTCVSCHLRSGLGSNEGGVTTPPTNGEHLYKPLYYYYKGFEVTNELVRPAYTDETLALSIRTGVEASGRALDPVMPRYLLDDGDMAMLIFYLKSLSGKVSPGVSQSTIKLATVVGDDVSQDDQEAMLAPLRQYVENKNKQVKAYEANPRRARMAKTMITGTATGGIANSDDILYKNLSLSVWKLTGPADTWKGQLEEYNLRDPVFIMVGGIVSGDWRPVHEFCEENRIPCLMPVTDYPVVSDTDWYTYYLSKGYYQEGEAAANYIDGKDDLSKGDAVVQIVRDTREGRALSEGFQRTWMNLGHDSPKTVTLKAGEPLTGDDIRNVINEGKPASILLWAGPEDAGAIGSLADVKDGPAAVVVSYGYLGKGIWTLPDRMRDIAYITYPYRLPKDEAVFKRNVDAMLKSTGVKDDDRNIVARTYSTVQTLNLTLMDLRGNYYRDYFFDTLGMMEDQAFPLYERLSFGPGQRYASKGCYIVQMTKGASPELVKKSDWVIH